MKKHMLINIKKLYGAKIALYNSGLITELESNKIQKRINKLKKP